MKDTGEYWNYATDQITSFGSGDMLAGTSWQYQLNNLPDAPVAAIKPAEGTTGWSDTWMIATEAAHPGCMYRWMNWMLSPDANAQATVWFGEAPVTQAACDVGGDAVCQPLRGLPRDRRGLLRGRVVLEHPSGRLQRRGRRDDLQVDRGLDWRLDGNHRELSIRS